ncbi:proline-rich receptor-like protein kinase PERK2 [Phalaenopsis equestris]|uniref:proline-rich receptor-like protein kinase PERK2 n=1 Tax=Phalaenopsis equestris TaxID=78828 RepID=UPI0009E5D711|nr:proline-rich receptor-like protein kinase PERK2 [Phalaenopsis equestris]
MASIPAKIPTFLLSLLLLFPHRSIADHQSPELSPAPAPFPGDLASGPFKALSLPSPPSSSSPLSDPSPDLAPHYSPSSPFSASFPTPAAEPDSSTFSTPPFDLIDGEDQSDLQSRASENEYSSGDGSGGMTGGKKASVVIASVAGVAVVGMGALVYKKRRDNIRRARYGYATRRDLL